LILQTNGKRETQQIELAIGDTEIIHVSSAMTVQDMWDQLMMVKELKGQLGVLVM